tara:strand:- start:624 stop:2363 length:1740 start_codon:yes stop_codon:yes gene_type:complete
MIKIFKIFWKSLNRKFRTYFFISIGFTLLSSVAEMLTIGTFLPLISVIISSSPEQNVFIKYLVEFNDKFSLGFENDLLIFFAIVFLTLVAISTFTRVLVLWWNAHFVKELSIKFSSLIISDMLSRNYKHLIGKDHNKIFSIFLNKLDRFIDYIQHYISIIGNLIISSAIVISLLFLDYLITAQILIFFILFYVSLLLFIKKNTTKISKIISENLDNRVSSINDSLIYLRQILLNNSQNFFINKFIKYETKIRETTKKVYIYYSFPKIFLEAIAIFAILIIAYSLLTIWNLEKDYIVTILAVIAYGSQKLLVYINQIYHSLTVLNSLKDTSLDVINEINLNKINTSKNVKIDNWENLKFNNVSFAYNDEKILENLNFSIKKNSFIGICGKTGSGKTTLLDMLSYLLEPTKGSISLDGKKLQDKKKSWQEKISYVPQNVYLSETSIINNIIVHQDEKIDKNMLRKVCKIACCEDFIKDLDNDIEKRNQYSNPRLSGGQVQRIGIARALYQDTEILLLDEATNALDSETEKKLMDNIKRIYDNKTVIIISHKESTLKYCDKIIYLEKKKVGYFGSYKGFTKL